MKRFPVFADSAVLSKYNGTTSGEINAEFKELHYRGWKFRSHHDKICDSDNLTQLAIQIESTLSACFGSVTENAGADTHDGEIHVDNQKLRIPPMLFLNDILNIE